jgi:hypothetical protein
MAKITIDNLPTAISLDGTELIPIDQSNGAGGYVTKHTTSGAISDVSVQAQYVLVGLNPKLPFARLLSGTSGEIDLTDNGAGETIVLSLAETGVTVGAYGNSTHFLSITVDAQGRITSASNVDAVAFLTSIIANLPTAPIVTPTLWLNGGILTYS